MTLIHGVQLSENHLKGYPFTGQVVAFYEILNILLFFSDFGVYLKVYG